jgi:O-antigen ligase
MSETAPKPGSDRSGGVWGACIRYVTGAYVDRDPCDAAFERMHRRDAIGDKVMLTLGVLGLISLFGPITMMEIAMIPFFVFFLIRVINTFPVWIHGFGQPTVLAALALVAWMFVALIWSEDRAHGLSEIGRLRWLFMMGFLFPIIEKRAVLVGAICVGIALGQVGQVLDAFNGFGIEPIAKLVENHEGRIAGWWHPVVGGGILVAAMGLHMPAALWGSGSARMVGIAGLSVSAIGVLATGTRGAWAAAALLCVVGLLLMVRVRRVPMKRVALAGAIGAALLGVTGFVIRDSIMIRINETRTELREMESGDYSSYSGRRVQMAHEAIGAIRAHPIHGVGTGSYQHWCASQSQAYGAHAHNSTLHILATLGIVGGLLWAGLMVVVLANAYRWGIYAGASPYAMGPLLAIVGLMLASTTDSVHINAQSVALLGVLVALCPAYAPGADIWREQE